MGISALDVLSSCSLSDPRAHAVTSVARTMNDAAAGMRMGLRITVQLLATPMPRDNLGFFDFAVELVLRSGVDVGDFFNTMLIGRSICCDLVQRALESAM